MFIQNVLWVCHRVLWGGVSFVGTGRRYDNVCVRRIHLCHMTHSYSTSRDTHKTCFMSVFVFYEWLVFHIHLSLLKKPFSRDQADRSGLFVWEAVLFVYEAVPTRAKEAPESLDAIFVFHVRYIYDGFHSNYYTLKISRYGVRKRERSVWISRRDLRPACTICIWRFPFKLLHP